MPGPKGSDWRPGALLATSCLVISAGLLLPLVSVLSESRSLVGLVRGAGRLGLIEGGQRAVLVVVYGIPVLAAVVVSLILVEVIRGSSRRLRLSTGLMGALVSATGVTSSIAALGARMFGVADAPRFGATIIGVGGVAGLISAVWFVRVPTGFSGGNLSRRFGGLVCLVAGLGSAASLLGIAFQVTRPSGEPSARKAAEAFVDAIQQRNPIAAIELLTPAERSLFGDLAPSLVREVSRLDLAPSFWPGSSNLPGRPFHTFVPAAAIDEKVLQLGVVQVAFPPGSARLATELPSIAARPRIRETLLQTGFFSDAESQRSVLVTTTEVSGRWFVSLGHTVVGAYSRAQNPKAVPDLSVKIDRVAAGASTPEAAVRSSLSALTTFEADEVLATLDPDEASPLELYADTVFPDRRAQAASLRTQYDLSFPELGLELKTRSEGASVFIARWSARLVLIADDVDDSVIVADNDCVTMTVVDVETVRCGAEVPLVLSDVFGVSARLLSEQQSLWVTEPLEHVPPVVVVQKSGRWFVSPIRTLLFAVEEWLSEKSADDFQGPGRTINERVEAILAIFPES
jgi:hypothetical protein